MSDTKTMSDTEPLPPVMDEQIRAGFANVLSEIAKVGADAREAASRSRETASAVGALTGDVERLKRAVFGTSPPPTQSAPVVARITEGEGTVADLTGRVLALQAEVAEVKQQHAEQLVVLRKISTSLGGVLASPLARRIALALGTLVLLWLSHAQAKLQGVIP